MKTIRSFYKYVLALILMMSGAQTLQAQDAFYIYRNDGNFDGFFYDEIVRMGYSKTDLEGEEHDVYVVQEIETKDSLYRIPLAAIDSIGFQQPEIRLNPKLKMMNTCGLHPYVKSVSQYENAVYFQNLPASMRPQVGDVLIGIDDNESNLEIYGAGGFGGIVRDFQVNDDITLVFCDEITDLGQVIDQLICVEQVGTDSQGNTRRRLAGINEDGSLRSAPRKLNGNFNVSIIDWAGRLTFSEKEDANVNFNLGIDLGINVKAKFVYAITGVFKKRFFVKATLSEDFSAGLSGDLVIKGEKSWEYDPFMGLAPAFKFPSFLPIFEIAPYPKGFIRLHGDFDTKLKLPSFKLGMAQTLTMDSDDPWFVSVKWGDRDKESEGYKVAESDFNWIGLNMSFNGWIHAGSTMPLYLATNSWIKKIVNANIGMEFNAGPKISASLNLNLTAQHGATYDYEALKDSKVELDICSLTSQAGASAEVMGKNKIERTIWETEKKYLSFEWFLFPEFTTNENRNVVERTLRDSNGDPYYQKELVSIDFEVFPRRQVCVPLELGVGLYSSNQDNYKLIEAQWYEKKYSFTNNYISYKFSFPCAGRPKGGYVIRPIIRFGDSIYPATGGESSFSVDEDGHSWEF